MLDMKIIGENIRTERKRQLLTIDRLAEMVGITENFLGKIERVLMFLKAITDIIQSISI